MRVVRVVEVFCCSGGLSEGFRRAGLPVSMAFDYDADVCDSHEANTGLRPVQIDVHDLLRMVLDGVSLGPVDLLVADPPCTPWSRAGKRLGQADDRDMLDATVALVRAIRPRAWLIANVPGLDDGPNWPIVQRTIGGLTREGYCIDYTRLDAADFGVAQHRVRPFWYGHARGTPCIRWPDRTHVSAAAASVAQLPGFAPLQSWVTCREALGHLSTEDLGSPVRLRWKRRQNGNDEGSKLDEPAHVVGTITGSDGGGAKGARVIEWPWDSPSTVVTSGDRIGPPGHHGKSFLSSPNAIRLSEKAAAILQGFPPNWRFYGKTKRSRWSQIGMAMPPPLGEAVARSIARQLTTSRNVTRETEEEISTP